jgi:hypothetical protein
MSSCLTNYVVAGSYALEMLGALLDDGDLDGHGGLKGVVSGWRSINAE